MTDIDASNYYTPQRGYKDGWQDRQNGRASRCPTGFAGTATAYWDEYKIGYDDACKQIIADARRSIQEDKQFLAE